MHALIKSSCFMLLAAIIASTAGPASGSAPITYKGVRFVDSIRVDSLITTDGTLNTLYDYNILDFSFKFSSSNGEIFRIEKSNGGFANFQSAQSVLLATPSQMIFNFGNEGPGDPGFLGTSSIYVYNLNAQYYCIQINGCADFLGAGEVISPIFNGGGGFRVRAAQQGSQVIATAISGVPEPANWSLMIFGFGLSGTILRRRYSQASLATLAGRQSAC